MRRGIRLGCGVLLAVGLALPAAAQVRMKKAADGTILITNDGGSFALHGRPLVLRPVPRADWSDVIFEQAVANGVDPRLVQAIMQVESGYNARAVSRAGARGLMQLMPDTARLMQVSDVFEPAQNIRGGIGYLRQMIDRFGRLEDAVAAYNAGPGAVQRHRGIPPYAETRDYVDRVLTLYRGTAGNYVSGLVTFVASNVPARPNGLTQSSAPSRLSLALARGAFVPVARGQAAPPAPLAQTVAAHAAAAPADGRSVAPAASAAPVLALPVTPLPATPASGG